MYTYKDIHIEWLGHDGFLIVYKDKKICIDPFELKHTFQTDYIFFTHNHHDHLSIADIFKIIDPTTILVASSLCEDNLKDIHNKKTFLKQNDTLILDDFSVKTIPAYNIDKFRSPGIPYHPKESGYVGFLFNFDGTLLYHAGDTDIISEMEGLCPNIALLPVSGIYTMTAEEAVQAVTSIRPKIAIPMHYNTIVGTLKDAEYFQKYAQCKVVIL